MAWYGMHVCKHEQNHNFGTDASALECIEAFGKRLNTFRAFWEHMGAFGRPGRLVSIIPYVCMYGMVCSTITKNRDLEGSRSGALTPI